MRVIEKLLFVSIVMSFIGLNAQEVETSDQRTTVGKNTGSKGTQSIYIGNWSGNVVSSGRDNTFVGFYSGQQHRANGANTFIGSFSGASNHLGQHNSFLGSQSGRFSSRSSYNTILGSQAARGSENEHIGDRNVIIGFQAAYKGRGVSNTFIGTQSGFHVGKNSRENVFVGDHSGTENSNSYNTFVGYQTGHRNTGKENTFVGHKAGRSNYSGNYNTFVGKDSGGGSDTAKGKASYNTYVGYHSGAKNYNGDKNVFMGFEAGMNNDGSNNIFIGRLAGKDVKGSNLLCIESEYNDQFTPLIWGDFSKDIATIHGKLGVGTKTPEADFVINQIDPNNAGGNDSALVIKETGNNDKIMLHLHTNGQTQYGFFHLGGNTRFRSGKNNISTIEGALGLGVDSPQEKLHVNGNIRGGAQGGAVRIKTNHGWVDLGAYNKDWTHLYTDGKPLIVNTDIYSVNGGFSSYKNRDLYLKTAGSPRVIVKAENGHVGIGTNNPQEKLDVNGNAYFDGIIYATDKIGIGTDKFTGEANGEVYRLSVNGNARCTGKFRVYNTWADYVFSKDYQLAPLEEVESYIDTHGYLPNMPSAEEVEIEGLDLGDISRRQQEKIEELTLYLIEQNKQLKEQKDQIQELTKQVELLLESKKN